ncbi:MAG: extracellular solute-binding protein [Verrucomicrobia bacterium]|nr:extracellular solute-binding protein [Verrucomicrobiota bacterium]
MHHFLKRGAKVVILVSFLARALDASEKLVIISPHWEGIRFEFARAFSDWHRAQHGTTVEVDWRDVGGGNSNVKFVLSEFQQRPDGIGIDLFFGGGIEPFLELNRKGLLERYQPALDGIPSQLGGVPIYDDGCRWFGTALSGFGILYNKRVLAARGWPVPSTWRELAEQALIGSVASSDPRASSTMHVIYEMLLQRYGWDDGWGIIYQLCSKVRHFDRLSSTTAKQCAIGNTAYALAIDFYALTQIAATGKENMGFVLPRDCVVVNPDCIGILRGAPHRTLAQRFVEFCLSETGQNLFMLPRGHPGGAQRFSIERMSVRPALYGRWHEVSLVTINPFAEPISFQYDASKDAARSSVVNSLIGATIIDVHPELIAAARRGTLDVRPPVGEEEAMRLAKGEWRDTRFRLRKELEWQRWAYERYTKKPH